MGSSGFPSGGPRLGPAPQTLGSGLLRPRTASSWFPPCARFQRSKLTADGRAGSQLRQGLPAHSRGRSSRGTSGGRRGLRRVTTAFSIHHVPPRRLPAASAGVRGCSNGEQSSGIQWPGARHAAQHPQGPGQSPPASSIWGPSTTGPERTHSEAVHKNGSAPVTKKAWPGSLCTRPHVSYGLIQGRAEMPLPQSVHLGGFWVAGLWENRFLLYFVRSSLSPWDYFCFILQVWRRTADREDRRAQTPSSPRWGSTGPRFPSPHQWSGKAPGAEPEPQGLGEPSHAPWWTLDPRLATTEPSKSALGDRPFQVRKQALRG